MNTALNPFDLDEIEYETVDECPQREGIFFDLSNEQYHQSEGISKSGLDLIDHCPSSYMWSKQAPSDPNKTKALDMGTAIHTLLLEPDLFNQQFAVEPEINRRTNAGKEQVAEFEQANAGKTIITHEDQQKLILMRDSVMAHPTARWIFEQAGVNEASIYWTDDETGELCRIRPDRMLINHPYIIDVKKVDGIDRFARHAEEFRYHVQDAMYSEGFLRGHEKEAEMFLFLAIDSSISAGRYAVDVIQLEPDWKRRGHELFRRNLATYHQCKVDNDWMHIRTLNRPMWAVRSDEG